MFRIRGSGAERFNMLPVEDMGKNFKMCTNVYFFEKKSELSELH